MKIFICLCFCLSLTKAIDITDPGELEKVYLVGKRGIKVIDLHKLSLSLIPQLSVLGKATPPKTNSIDSQGGVCVTRGCVKIASLIIANINETIDPCTDFYNFACGGYIDRAVIPDSKSSVSLFSDMSDHLMARMRLVLHENSTSKDSRTTLMAKNLYKSCMNETLTEELGLSPLLEILAELGEWPVVTSNWIESNFSLLEILETNNKQGFSINTLFYVDVGPDDKNSSRRTIILDQPELGLDREYLLSGLNDSVVHAYLDYAINVAVLLGASSEIAEREMADMIFFEMQLANISTPKELRRNFTELYHVVTISELQNIVPQIQWLDLMNKILPSNAQVTLDQTVDIVDMDYIKKFTDVISHVDNRTLANYMLWRVIKEAASYLSYEITELEFQYYTVVNGESESSPRWKDCVSQVQDLLPFAMGNLYIKNYFKEEAKTKTEMMVQYLRKSFDDILKSVDWMDTATKARALEKSKAIKAHIAYPNELLMDSKLEEFYGDLKVDDQSLLGNVMRISAFLGQYYYGLLHQDADPNDWKLQGAVAEVNAYYYSNVNAIIFPAGILQGVLFDPSFPQYVNFAGIGMIIGHEITHAFDDSGKQFDAEGNLNNWWDPETEHKFTEKAQCIVDQYSNYVQPEVGMKLNGINSQGEDIADNGGTKESYMAYQQYVRDHGPEPTLPGLSYSSNQLYWIALAQKHCEISRPEQLRLQILTDEHTPKRFRVIGTVSNSQEFAKDFNCPAGSKMNPTHKCEVW